MSNVINTFDFKHIRVYYRVNTVDEDVMNHSFSNDIFYKGIPEYKKTNGVVVDIGAHIGTFSVFSAVEKNARKVYAIEPNEESYQLLERNVVENKLDNTIVPLNLAISNTSGLIKLYLDSENWGHSITNEQLVEYVNVHAVTFKDLMESENISFCDLVKFNCEGAEFQILLSMDKGEMDRIGMMLILFHEDMVEGKYTKADLVSFLRSRNFLVRLSNLKNKRGWIIAKNKKYYSWLAHRLFSLKLFLFRKR